MRAEPDGWAHRLAGLQGLFYLVSGIWPILHLPSFLAVTGPKVDTWLVQTVGGLLAVTGAVLLLVAWRRRYTAEWGWLAAGMAAVLAVVDVYFVARDVIPPIYLADAVAEFALVIGWIGIAVRRMPVARR